MRARRRPDAAPTSAACRPDADEPALMPWEKRGGGRVRARMAAAGPSPTATCAAIDGLLDRPPAVMTPARARSPTGAAPSAGPDVEPRRP
jgi:hypothetical protein